MGTTLTGTTPQDTYDSLIKVTDNGPLSGTAKYLSDGLGNDSALALSTSRVGIGTASPSNLLHLNKASEPELYIQDSVSTFRLGLNSDNQFFVYTAQAKDIYFSNNNAERLRITSAGNVGIGTSSPPADTNLTVLGNFQSGFYRNVTSGDRGYLLHLGANTSGGTLTNAATIVGILESGDASGYLSLQTRAAGALSTQMTITSAGVVELAQGQIKFPVTQVASADPNTLDDYEEGTWTPTISFGRASVGVTYGAGNAGQYTKVGRQVTLTAFVILTSKGSSTGTARIGGLPFVIGNATGYYSAPVLGAFSQLSYTGTAQGFGEVNAQTIELNEVSEAGTQTDINDTNFTDSTSFIVSFTYFV